jgi:hypothetical protein
MGEYTVKFCDRCGLDDSKGGAGEGGVALSTLKFKEYDKPEALEFEMDLCDGCREDMRKFVTDFKVKTSPRR